MIKLLSFLAVTAILSFTPQTGQDKEYTCHLTLNEYNILISDQNDVSVNARKAVIQKVVGQINQQLTDTLPPKKK